jgi:hypothetical protein
VVRQVTEYFGQHGQADARMHHVLHLREPVLGLAPGSAENRQDARHDQHGVRIPPRRRAVLLDAAVERDRVILGLLLGVDQVGDASAQILSRTRGARLRDHGIALNGPCHVQWSLHLQDVAPMVQGSAPSACRG